MFLKRLMFEKTDVFKQRKKLSFREQTLLEKAKFLIVSEVTMPD